jgi:hypothetical protein
MSVIIANAALAGLANELSDKTFFTVDGLYYEFCSEALRGTEVEDMYMVWRNRPGNGNNAPYGAAIHAVRVTLYRSDTVCGELWFVGPCRPHPA